MYFAEICVERLEHRNRPIKALPNDIGLLVMELEGTPSAQNWPLVLVSARLAPVRTARMAELTGVSPARMRAMLGEMADTAGLKPLGNDAAVTTGQEPGCWTCACGRPN